MQSHPPQIKISAHVWDGISPRQGMIPGNGLAWHGRRLIEVHNAYDYIGLDKTVVCTQIRNQDNEEVWVVIGVEC